MPLPTSKTELLANLEKAYSNLIKEFDAVPNEFERESAFQSIAKIFGNKMTGRVLLRR